MKFDRRYWVLIAAAISCASVSSASTLYMASVQEHFMECNSTSAACFAAIGMVPCMVLGVLALLPLMVAVSCYFLIAQNNPSTARAAINPEKPGVFVLLVSVATA